MNRFIFLVILFFGQVGWFPEAAHAQNAADTVATGVPEDPPPMVRGFVRTRFMDASGVRIRLLRDNRGVRILRLPMRVLPTVPTQDSMALAGPMLADTARIDLYRMETRLIEHIDRRLVEFERSQRAALTALVRSPSSLLQSRDSGSGSAFTTPIPIPVPVGGRADALTGDTLLASSQGTDTSTVDTLLTPLTAADTTGDAGLALTLPRHMPPPRTSAEVERAILDTGLLRTVSVLFENNQATLLPASATILSALGIVLERHPDVRLEVRGHTDSRGTAEHNLHLSQARASAVRVYLLKNFAIDAQRLLAQGYGEARPIADDFTATGRALNRRVEFVVLGQ
ncbi:MAG: OmpA family protein [Candidatus Krumholzibacteria bacterium]|nr:OmpA family protein [Candidatus Krumholzibacteria bacterium]